ncbi:autotransporter domain-containing protein, partial [Ursidibacter sp. B-7004-1]
SNKATLAGYQETGLRLPIHFGEIRLSEKTAALGVKLQKPFTEKVKGVLSAQVEQQLSGKSPVYTAQGNFVGSVNKTMKINTTRAKLQAGISYQLKPNMEVSVLPYIERGIYGSKRYGA